jgi:hypothetical protein
MLEMFEKVHDNKKLENFENYKNLNEILTTQVN